MNTQTIAALAIMVIMVAGTGLLIFKFVQSIRAKRAYANEELPDIYNVEAEDEVLPDIEESGFSQLGEDFSSDEESASEIYREIYEGGDRRAK